MMVATDIGTRDGWVVAVNEDGEEDWGCPECGGRLSSCCGNSHIWCYACGYELWDFAIQIVLTNDMKVI